MNFRFAALHWAFCEGAVYTPINPAGHTALRVGLKAATATATEKCVGFVGSTLSFSRDLGG